jgi:integrase
MSRPRKKDAHLPKYVRVEFGSYWYRPPEGPNVKIGPEGQEHLVWKFMLDKAEPSSAPLITLNDCFDRYLKEVLPSLGVRTQKDYARHIAILRRVFGHMHPDEVRPRDVGAFLDRLKGKIQANRQVAVLSAIYSKMVGRWYCADKNPCANVERNPSKKRTRYITDAEFDAVRAIAKPRIQIAMDLALLTGQRQGDLLNLPQSNVTDEGILFKQGKTGKRLLVEMSPSLQAVVDRAKAMVPVVDIGGYVLRTRRGKPYTSEGFRACWQRTINKAMKLRAIDERFTFHDIRAKSVSDTKDIQKAFERAGHTSMAMTRGVYDRGVRKVTPLR